MHSKIAFLSFATHHHRRFIFRRESFSFQQPYFGCIRQYSTVKDHLSTNVFGDHNTTTGSFSLKKIFRYGFNTLRDCHSYSQNYALLCCTIGLRYIASCRLRCSLNWASFASLVHWKQQGQSSCWLSFSFSFCHCY